MSTPEMELPGTMSADGGNATATGMASATSADVPPTRAGLTLCQGQLLAGVERAWAAVADAATQEVLSCDYASDWPCQWQRSIRASQLTVPPVNES